MTTPTKKGKEITSKPTPPPTPKPDATFDYIFRKGGYEPAEAAPANPTPPGKPGTKGKSTSEQGSES